MAIDDPKAAPPYVKFYPRDFMDGVMALPAHLRGCHISLLCYQWTARTVPGDDPAQLRNIMGVASNAEAKKAWEAIKHKYPQHADGRYLNRRLEDERVKVEKLFADNKAKGEKGGRPRKQKPQVNPRLNPGVMPRVIPQPNPRHNPRGNPQGNPDETQPDPDPKPRSGSTTVPGSETAPRSSDLAKPERTETSTPSDAQAQAGWSIWAKAKAWLDANPDVGVTGRSFFDKVYVAAVKNGRLELFIEDARIAQSFVESWSSMTSDALAAAGAAGMPWCVIAKRQKLAKARVG